jgi:hypothetical protein
MAHLASFECLLLDALGPYSGGGPTPYLDQWRTLGNQGFNETQVALRDTRARADVMDEYTRTHERTLHILVQISPEVMRQPGTLPWYGMEYALDDFIVYAYYGHKREHMAQVNVFKEKLKAERAAKQREPWQTP